MMAGYGGDLMGFGEIKEGPFEYYNNKNEIFDLSLNFKIQTLFNWIWKDLLIYSSAALT